MAFRTLKYPLSSPERTNFGDKEHSISNIVKVVSGQNDEILEIINLNNLKKLNDSVSETMTKYGETEYNNRKNPDQPNWNELSQSEKLNYIPNYEIASELP